jgi:hypothetical protein
VVVERINAVIELGTLSLTRPATKPSVTVWPLAIVGSR